MESLPNRRYAAKGKLVTAQALRQKLESLRDLTQANSLTEVVQGVLAVYDFLHAEKQKGNQLIVKGPDGGEKEVVLL